MSDPGQDLKEDLDAALEELDGAAWNMRRTYADIAREAELDRANTAKLLQRKYREAFPRLESMAKVAAALGYRLKVVLERLRK